MKNRESSSVFDANGIKAVRGIFSLKSYGIRLYVERGPLAYHDN